MQFSTSLLIDVLRFSAAGVVFLSHLTSRDFNQALPPMPWGHDAVVAFFVISGFVIAHVISTRERSIATYSAARLGRLYSVVLPALALTIVLDSVGRIIDPAIYEKVPNDLIMLRIGTNLLFIQQNWNLTVIPLSNGPFWSLGYEFHYYLIFGASFLLIGRARVLVVTLLCFLAGPRILAAFPLWLLGVLSYHIYRLWVPSSVSQWSLIVFSTTAICLVFLYGNPLIYLRHSIHTQFPTNYIEFSTLRIFLGDTPQIPEDLLLGALLAVLFIGVRGDALSFAGNRTLVGTLRYLAGSTFSIYLFHAPLLYFFTALTGMDKTSSLHVLGIGATVLVSCIGLSHLTERRVHYFKQFFERAFAAMAKAANLHK